MIYSPRSQIFSQLVLALVVSICIAASCRAPPTETNPEQAVSLVLKHLYEGNWDAAWVLITRENQQKFLEQHQTLAKATGVPPSNSAKDAFLSYGLMVHALPETTKLSSHPDRSPAQVRVTLAYGSGTTLTVHRDSEGRWRVDVLGALRAVHPDEPSEAQPPR
ncbi:MAG: hypothetical protein KTR25_19215 [Myxococcales bacterium]|nr:hypothetical protein [Myxococcales bacterium]